MLGTLRCCGQSLSWPVALSWVGLGDMITLKTQLNSTGQKSCQFSLMNMADSKLATFLSSWVELSVVGRWDHGLSEQTRLRVRTAVIQWYIYKQYILAVRHLHCKPVVLLHVLVYVTIEWLQFLIFFINWLLFNPFTANPFKALLLPYWSNSSFFFNFWHSGALALRTERQSARMSKMKYSGLDQCGTEPFKQHQFGTAGVEGVNGNRNENVLYLVLMCRSYDLLLFVGCISWRCWAERTSMDDRKCHKWMAVWCYICCRAGWAIFSTYQWDRLGHTSMCSAVLKFA